jgi:hypothetical protein
MVLAFFAFWMVRYIPPHPHLPLPPSYVSTYFHVALFFVSVTLSNQQPAPRLEGQLPAAKLERQQPAQLEGQ